MRSRQAFPFHHVCEQTVLRKFMCDTSSVINPRHDHDIVEVYVATQMVKAQLPVSSKMVPRRIVLPACSCVSRQNPGVRDLAKRDTCGPSPKKVQRFVTQLESRCRPCMVLEDAKVHNRHRNLRFAKRSVDDGGRVAERGVGFFAQLSRGTATGWALQRMAKDYGHEVKVVLETDSVAGRDMSLRMGAGKVRRNTWQLFFRRVSQHLFCTKKGFFFLKVFFLAQPEGTAPCSASTQNHLCQRALVVSLLDPEATLSARHVSAWCHSEPCLVPTGAAFSRRRTLPQASRDHMPVSTESPVFAFLFPVLADALEMTLCALEHSKRFLGFVSGRNGPEKQAPRSFYAPGPRVLLGSFRAWVSFLLSEAH